MAYLHGYSTTAQNRHWNEAATKYPESDKPGIVRVNYLKKHFYYTADEAWDIVNRIEGEKKADPHQAALDNFLNAIQPTDAQYIVQYNGATLKVSTMTEVELLREWQAKLGLDEFDVFQKI